MGHMPAGPGFRLISTGGFGPATAAPLPRPRLCIISQQHASASHAHSQQYPASIPTTQHNTLEPPLIGSLVSACPAHTNGAPYSSFLSPTHLPTIPLYIRYCLIRFVFLFLHGGSSRVGERHRSASCFLQGKNLSSYHGAVAVASKFLFLFYLGLSCIIHLVSEGSNGWMKAWKWN